MQVLSGFGRMLSDEQLESTCESLCPVSVAVLAVMVLSAGLGMQGDPERSIALSLAMGLPALVFAILFLGWQIKKAGQPKD
ncbi:MAG: hypothetical protein ACFFC0_09630 [Promethearchaeota archaeon]